MHTFLKSCKRVWKRVVVAFLYIFFNQIPQSLVTIKKVETMQTTLDEEYQKEIGKLKNENILLQQALTRKASVAKGRKILLSELSLEVHKAQQKVYQLEQIIIGLKEDLKK